MQTPRDPSPLTPTELRNALGISMPYASQILSGKRPPTAALAVRIYRKTGHKIGPLIDVPDAEIIALEKHLKAIDRFRGVS